ncbi:unnamed protein product [Blepharisma stoltei]|uniref:Uncharacterized protein n=1 Tax=Blepharisma stoltei TaxID=1481888 RepID=A0AAU9KDY3_9CILI|nr:unnamed protein product [Blepharisma stoltei]
MSFVPSLRSKITLNLSFNEIQRPTSKCSQTATKILPSLSTKRNFRISPSRPSLTSRFGKSSQFTNRSIDRFFKDNSLEKSSPTRQKSAEALRRNKLAYALDIARTKRSKIENEIKQETERLRSYKDTILFRELLLIKYNNAAVIIQKHIRGFLTRKKIESKMMELWKKKLNKSIEFLDQEVKNIYIKLGCSIIDKVVLIQKHIKGYLKRKRFRAAANRLREEKLMRRDKATKMIISWIKTVDCIINLKELKEKHKKLTEIRDKLLWIKMKQLWSTRKFNWSVIKKKYELLEQTLITESDRSKTAQLLIAPITYERTKSKNFEQLKKPSRRMSLDITSKNIKTPGRLDLTPKSKPEQLIYRSFENSKAISFAAMAGDWISSAINFNKWDQQLSNETIPERKEQPKLEINQAETKRASRVKVADPKPLFRNKTASKIASNNPALERPKTQRFPQRKVDTLDIPKKKH